ncbi:MAG TPA: sulfite exporter TauE/SafE family protein [Thermohalobaculum sp.]|nr:sulfite exporter TauE/SafE family protein [Thermohalobaculum sp.]
MLELVPDAATLTLVLLGALAAGFISGFAGFGTALVASGFWFHAMPPQLVPPLVVLAGVTGQMVGFLKVRKSFEWGRALPYIAPGIAGVPLGVAALAVASPDDLRLSVGLFLAVYAAFQLAGLARFSVGGWGGRAADATVGFAGGVLGGFAGLSGALPLVWLQMRGGPSATQRATYQPFNMVVLVLAAVGMAIAGQIDARVLGIGAICLPATLASAWFGARLYGTISEAMFRRIVLVLLLTSGTGLITQALW